MQHDQAYLLDILEAARLAVVYARDVSQADFLQDTQLQDAVIRRIEIMGEASKRISQSTRESHPEIPWSEMAGMRNLMIHDYDDVDLDIVWDTLQHDLPHLITVLEPLVPPEQP
jgi:uncharacterized protein with HEPN domain